MPHLSYTALFVRWHSVQLPEACTAPGLGQEVWRAGRCRAGKAEDLQKGWAVGQGLGTSMQGNLVWE